MDGMLREFAVIDWLLASDSPTRGVDAFALCLIKTERQARRLLTYLVYQFAVFGPEDVRGLRKALAAEKCVYVDGLFRGIDALSPRTVKELVGPRYDELKPKLDQARGYRNKIFHGQLTDAGLRREQLVSLALDMKSWSASLAQGATREFEYDGLAPQSFRKSEHNLAAQYRMQIKSIEAYSAFIKNTMCKGKRH